MADYPADLKYTADHEWVSLNETTARVGVTDYAQDALGDVVYVSLPAVGDTVAAGDPCGEIESTKSVSEMYSPLAGTVSAVNESLDASPELVNSDPYGDGWMYELEVAEDVATGDLMDVEAYKATVE